MPVIKIRIFLPLLCVLILVLLMLMDPITSATGEISSGGFLKQIIWEKGHPRKGGGDSDHIVKKIGRKINEFKEEDNGGISVSNKFHKRNEKIRSKFNKSLEKIKSTCSKYGKKSSKLPRNKNFSIGKNSTLLM